MLIGLGRQHKDSHIERQTSDISQGVKKEKGDLGVMQRMNSDASVMSNLRLPGQKKRVRKNESDIDGELMSKPSNRMGGIGNQSLFMGEVDGNAINKEWINEVDNFLFEEDEENETLEEIKVVDKNAINDFL